MSIQNLIGAFFPAVGLTSSLFAADLRPDVSQLIDKSEATAILSEPVKDPSPRSGDGADGEMEKVSGIGDAAQMFTGVATAASLRDSSCFTLPTGMHFSPLALAVLSTMPSPWKRRGPSRKNCSSIFDRGERRD